MRLSSYDSCQEIQIIEVQCIYQTELNGIYLRMYSIVHQLDNMEEAEKCTPTSRLQTIIHDTFFQSGVEIN